MKNCAIIIFYIYGVPLFYGLTTLALMVTFSLRGMASSCIPQFMGVKKKKSPGGWILRPYVQAFHLIRSVSHYQDWFLNGLFWPKMKHYESFTEFFFPK